MSQNISLTAGNTHNETYLDATANASDKMIAFIKVNGVVVKTKRSAAFGGDANQIAINAGVSYVVKLEAIDTAQLPTSNVTWELHKSTDAGALTEKVDGNVTVTGASAEDVYGQSELKSFKYQQTFTADGVFDVQSPSTRALKYIFYKNIGDAESQAFNIGTTSTGSEIASLTSASETWQRHTVADAKSYWEGENVYVSAASWVTAAMEIMLVWEEFNA